MTLEIIAQAERFGKQIYLGKITRYDRISYQVFLTSMKPNLNMVYTYREARSTYCQACKRFAKMLTTKINVDSIDK